MIRSDLPEAAAHNVLSEHKGGDEVPDDTTDEKRDGDEIQRPQSTREVHHNGIQEGGGNVGVQSEDFGSHVQNFLGDCCRVFCDK